MLRIDHTLRNGRNGRGRRQGCDKAALQWEPAQHARPAIKILLLVLEILHDRAIGRPQAESRSRCCPPELDAYVFICPSGDPTHMKKETSPSGSNNKPHSRQEQVVLGF